MTIFYINYKFIEHYLIFLFTINNIIYIIQKKKYVYKDFTVNGVNNNIVIDNISYVLHAHFYYLILRKYIFDKYSNMFNSVIP